MTLRRRAFDYGLAGLLLLLPALILRANFKDPQDTTKLDEAILRVTAPLQAVVSWVIEGVGGVLQDYMILIDVEDENDELREENAKLRKELAVMARRAFDAEEVEDLVGLKRDTPADTIGARVIAASTSPFFRVLRIRIDRGFGEVQPDMPVLTPAGLVGRIHKVYGGHADIMLATDPLSAIDVVIARTGSRGVLTGLGRADSYACEIEWVEKAAGDRRVQVDDKVVTSGLGGAFPPGIPVGHVTAVSETDLMFQEVIVEPVVDFSRLRAVMVLLAPPPPPDPDADKKRRSEPAFGVRAL